MHHRSDWMTVCKRPHSTHAASCTEFPKPLPAGKRAHQCYTHSISVSYITCKPFIRRTANNTSHVVHPHPVPPPPPPPPPPAKVALSPVPASPRFALHRSHQARRGAPCACRSTSASVSSCTTVPYGRTFLRITNTAQLCGCSRNFCSGGHACCGIQPKLGVRALKVMLDSAQGCAERPALLPPTAFSSHATMQRCSWCAAWSGAGWPLK